MGLVESKTLKNLLYQKFEQMPHVNFEEDDPLARGEFEVIKQLCASISDASEGKTKIDILIDKCGVPPLGVGVQNLRECIMETKYKYDVAPEEKQAVFKERIMNFIERYFYMVCFSHYNLKFGPTGYQKTFKMWIEENPEIIKMGVEGKSKLEWSRTVDAAKLEKLKEMVADPNFKDNLGPIIRTIYEFAFLTYADLPRGPIKNNSMRKLASTTLMEILPLDLAEKISKKIDEDPGINHDFVTVVGMISSTD